MRKNEKKFYSYWELPDWQNDEVEVSRIYTHNDKEHLVIRYGIRIFHIPRPKKGHWDNVAEGDKINVTKLSTGTKRALLMVEK